MILVLNNDELRIRDSDPILKMLSSESVAIIVLTMLYMYYKYNPIMRFSMQVEFRPRVWTLLDWNEQK